MLYRRGKTWWTRTTVAGTLVRKSLKTTDRFVAQQAENAIVRTLGLRAAGIETHGETKAVSPALLIEEYIGEQKRRGLVRWYVHQTGSKLRRLIGSLPSLDKVTPETIRRDLGKVAEETSPATSNYYRIALSGFFKWLVTEGRWSENPVTRVRPAEVLEAKRRRRSLTAEERDRLLAAAPTARSVVYRLALTSGLRRAELRALTLADLDLDGGTVRVRAASAKDGIETILPLPAGTIAALRAALRSGSPAARAFPGIPKMKAFRKDLEAASIQHVDAEGRILDFHALRVSFNTLLAREGVSLSQRQMLMRHKDPKLTANVYTRLEAVDAVAAVAKIDAPAVPNLYRTGRTQAHSRALATGTGPAVDSYVNAAWECAGAQGDAEEQALSLAEAAGPCTLGK